MNRYFIYLGYNGKKFCGWQVQPNGVTVQQCIEEALATILRQPVPIVGAGRTDAGVHARLMVAHFDWAEPIADLAFLAEKLNRLLPKDIAVYRIVPVCPDAHARFDATSRTYKYYITTQKDPFNYELVYKMSGKLDFEAMNRACQVLFDYIDFTSFSKLHTEQIPAVSIKPDGRKKATFGFSPYRPTVSCVIWCVPLSVLCWKSAGASSL